MVKPFCKSVFSDCLFIYAKRNVWNTARYFLSLYLYKVPKSFIWQTFLFYVLRVCCGYVIVSCFVSQTMHCKKVWLCLRVSLDNCAWTGNNVQRDKGSDKVMHLLLKQTKKILIRGVESSFSVLSNLFWSAHFLFIKCLAQREGLMFC